MSACNAAIHGPGADGKRTAGQKQTFVYNCDEGYRFVARIEAGSAWLFLPGLSVNLPNVASASGARYQGADHLYWSKGDDALFEPGDGRRLRCRNNRSQAIWEAAKLDGVDFRAIGNEPGWLLEISGDTLLLVTDYGRSRQEYRTPVAEIDADRRSTRYRVSDRGGRLVVEIVGKACLDSMSGERFPSTVSVTHGEKHYSGCGRALH